MARLNIFARRLLRLILRLRCHVEISPPLLGLRLRDIAVVRDAARVYLSSRYREIFRYNGSFA